MLATDNKEKRERDKMGMITKCCTVLMLFSNWFQCAIQAQDDWHRSSFPVEELTSGTEVGPSETRWGRLIKVNVKTSRRAFADTSGSVYITFYGKRATSDTFLLQEGFSAGSLDSIQLSIHHEIGELERVKLQTNSTDGWLMASMWLDIGPRTYYLESISTFLDYPDNKLADVYWDGDSRGNSFNADPVGKVAELYEPQAPSLTSPGRKYGEGLLGQSSVILNVDHFVDNYQDPFHFEEGLREQWDP